MKNLLRFFRISFFFISLLLSTAFIHLVVKNPFMEAAEQIAKTSACPESYVYGGYLLLTLFTVVMTGIIYYWFIAIPPIGFKDKR